MLAPAGRAGRRPGDRSGPRAAVDGGVSRRRRSRKARPGQPALAALLADNAELIRREQPKCPVNRCGYNLAGVPSRTTALDLARLLVGSEGTLALITEAHLATQPLPRHRGVALLLFDSLETASPGGAGDPAPPAQRLRPDGPPPPEPGPGDRGPLRPADSRARPRPCCWSSRRATTRSRSATGCTRLVDEIWHQQRLAFGARQAFDPDETRAVLAAWPTGSSRPRTG